MAREFAKKFYNSKLWRTTRKSYFDSQYGLCEKCKDAGLIVHHKIELSPLNINDPRISLSFSNLQLLCQVCHNKTHQPASATQDDLEFDQDGNIRYTMK